MKTKNTTDQRRKFVEQPTGPILVSVSDGVAEVIDSTVPKGIEIEIVNFDNLRESGREEFAKLSKAAQEYVLADDPDFQLNYEDAENK
jgi:hypothetical protein